MIEFRDTILNELIIIDPNDLAKVKISLKTPNEENNIQTSLNKYAVLFSLDVLNKTHDSSFQLLDRILLSTKISIDMWDKINFYQNNENIAAFLEKNDFKKVLIFGTCNSISFFATSKNLIEIGTYKNTKYLCLPDFSDFTKAVKEHAWNQIQILFNLK